MKTFVTFGQDHSCIIDGITFDKDCIAVVNGDRDKVFEIFSNKFCMEYSEKEFNIEDGINLYFRGLIEVPDKIATKIVLDPLNEFNNYEKSQILNQLGALPFWVVNPDYYEKSLKEALDEQYGFGLFESKKTIITENGVYKYPQDPDLYPLIKIERLDETFYQYEHALIAIVQKDGSSFASRMD